MLFIFGDFSSSINSLYIFYKSFLCYSNITWRTSKVNRRYPKRVKNKKLNNFVSIKRLFILSSSVLLKLNFFNIHFFIRNDKNFKYFWSTGVIKGGNVQKKLRTFVHKKVRTFGLLRVLPWFFEIFRASRAEIFFQRVVPWCFENFWTSPPLITPPFQSSDNVKLRTFVHVKVRTFGLPRVLLPWFFENFRASRRRNFFSKGTTLVFWKFPRAEIFFPRVLPWFFENFLALRARKFFYQGYYLLLP